jgi:uncharacterized membrane protein
MLLNHVPNFLRTWHNVVSGFLFGVFVTSKVFHLRIFIAAIVFFFLEQFLHDLSADKTVERIAAQDNCAWIELTRSSKVSR